MSSASRAIRELEEGASILVTRLEYLGDVVLSLALVHAIRRRFPHARIDYLTREAGADVLRGESVFSRVFCLPNRGAPLGATLRLIRCLRRRRYAVAIDLYSNPRSALLSLLSGARVRIGGARRIRRHFYTHAIRVPEGVRAATAHHAEALRPLGVNPTPERPVLTITPDELARARERLSSIGIDRCKRVVGLHPGGKWEVKRWAADRFAALGRRLLDNGTQVLILCGPREERYRDAVQDGLGGRGYRLPTMSARETASVVALLDALVVCDGGMMHVSVAAGTPTVAIFGSSEPDIWFPYESFGPFRAAVVPITCRPCHLHVCDHLSCLQRLHVDAVAARLEEVMDAAARGPAVRSE